MTERDSALVTRANVKTFYGITDTSRDTLIDLLIPLVSEAVSTHCDRKFTQATTTKYFDGDGGRELWLPHPPAQITGDTSRGIWVDSTREFAAGTKLVQAIGSTTTGDYILYGDEATDGEEDSWGKVWRISGNWPVGHRNIKVTYLAGYATIPNEIALACYEWMSYHIQQVLGKKHMVESESTGAGGGSTTVRLVSIPTAVENRLAKWRRMAAY